MEGRELTGKPHPSPHDASFGLTLAMPSGRSVTFRGHGVHTEAPQQAEFMVPAPP